MGIRMFAIYGLPLGLLIAGPLITQFGFAAMVTLYCLLGMVLAALIGLYWRREVWARRAPVNRMEAQ
jgi:hypothetical protein